MHPLEALMYYSGKVEKHKFNKSDYLSDVFLFQAALFPCYLGAHPFVSIAYIFDGALQERPEFG